MRQYKNFRKVKLPRIVEHSLHLLLYVLLLSIVHFLKIDQIIFNNNYDVSKPIFLLIVCLTFITYKLLTTHTIVEELNIDFDKKSIIIDYVFYFLFKRKLIIPFHEFSFYSKLDSAFSGGALSLRIFKANKFKIKISHRYGWKKKQIYCINKDFLKITDGIVRKASNWQEFYTLVKDNDQDCEEKS